MRVLILEARSDEPIKALIIREVSNQMSSINDNWVFDFNKHSKNKMVFKLVKENSPKTIEGCMIFSLHNTSGPYLDYLEVAPHNKG